MQQQEQDMSGPGSAALYEIRVEGILGPQWRDWLGNLQIEHDGSQTIISGSLADQAALHGLLAKVRDLGLCLISVQRLGQAGIREPG
jgi:hypothetical protein